MKPLQGKVAAIPTGATTPDASTIAHYAAIAVAAKAYVEALRAWEEHVTALRTCPEKTRYTTKRRARLHHAQKALIEAVAVSNV